MPSKSIRFADLVKTSGKPNVVTLWTKPISDQLFVRAMKENRVLTVRQEPSKKDFGQIGFHETPHSSYLIFPQPLPENKEARVVGVNYDLVEEPAVRDPAKLQRPQKPVKAISGLSRVKKFSVTIRRIATLEKQITVAAKNKNGAEKEALRQMKREPFELKEALLKTEVRNIE